MAVTQRVIRPAAAVWHADQGCHCKGTGMYYKPMSPHGNMPVSCSCIHEARAHLSAKGIWSDAQDCVIVKVDNPPPRIASAPPPRSLPPPVGTLAIMSRPVADWPVIKEAEGFWRSARATVRAEPGGEHLEIHRWGEAGGISPLHTHLDCGTCSGSGVPFNLSSDYCHCVHHAADSHSHDGCASPWGEEPLPLPQAD